MVGAVSQSRPRVPARSLLAELDDSSVDTLALVRELAKVLAATRDGQLIWRDALEAAKAKP